MPQKIHPMFVEVSLNLPMDSVWTYSVPLEYESQIFLGCKVQVSFLNKQKLGIVVRIHHEAPSFSTKRIENIVDDQITLPPYLFYMRDKISSYYGCSQNEALHLFVFDTRAIKSSNRKKRKESSPSLGKKKEILTLNAEQEKAVQAIWEGSQKASQFFPSLLYGITGSGKTEVYQSLMEKTLEDGKKQILLLLPEIGLTTQILERLSHRFSDQKIGFIHSRMREAQKQKTFQDISTGKIRIIIGPRSALFAPFNRLGLIIMDEEQDFSYKSQNSPRYHTRRVAFVLAKYLQIPFIMGSATPSVETYYAATRGHIHLYQLTQRFWGTSLPPVEIVDMQKSKEIFSERLLKKLVQTRSRKKQSILFLNRRGFSPFFVCEKCSYIFMCPSCSISLNYHKKTRCLLCHYCGFRQSIPSHCADCGSSQVRPRGTGTQRLEEEIQELFHGYRVLRMDRDSMRKKEAYKELMIAFYKKEADILIGTQMVSKGLDFPDVELVGIVSCDLVLHLPDFRAGEYVFSLITQMAGRSGRKTQGEVVLQTRFPHHYAIQSALSHDYIRFFNEEIAVRKEYGYPPFAKFIRLIIRSPLEDIALQVSQTLSQELKTLFPKVELMGPTACVLEKLHQQYRYHVLLRVKDPLPYMKEIKPLVKTHNKEENYHIECDVDPLSML